MLYLTAFVQSFVFCINFLHFKCSIFWTLTQKERIKSAMEYVCQMSYDKFVIFSMYEILKDLIIKITIDTNTKFCRGLI